MKLDSQSATEDNLLREAYLAIADLRWASNGMKVFAISIGAALLITASLYHWYSTIDSAQKSLNRQLLKEAQEESLLRNKYGAAYDSDNSSAFISFNTNVGVYRDKCKRLPCARFYIKKSP